MFLFQRRPRLRELEFEPRRRATACVSTPPIGRRRPSASRPPGWPIAPGSTHVRDAARGSAQRSRRAHWPRSRARDGPPAAPVGHRQLRGGTRARGPASRAPGARSEPGRPAHPSNRREVRHRGCRDRRAVGPGWPIDRYPEDRGRGGRDDAPPQGRAPDGGHLICRGVRWGRSSSELTEGRGSFDHHNWVNVSGRVAPGVSYRGRRCGRQ